MKKKLITIIVACYNEKDNILEMHKRVVAAFRNLKAYTFELLYVDNASMDTSVTIFERLAKQDKRVRVIFMSRNFGSPQPSFIAGMQQAKGNAVVFLHGDIQDPPQLIPTFINKWEKGYDVVYGIRKSREGYNFVWNLLYKGFYLVLKKLSYIQIPLNAGEFSLIDKKVMKELLAFGEYDYYLRGIRAYAGFRQVGVPYVRDSRFRGRSGENLLTSFWWAKTILVNFSFKPLEWISTIAFVVMLLALSLMIFDIVVFILHKNLQRGISTIVILILFLGSVQLLSLSVIAEYLAKIFLEVKKRPRFIIRRII